MPLSPSCFRHGATRTTARWSLVGLPLMTDNGHDVMINAAIIARNRSLEFSSICNGLGYFILGVSHRAAGRKDIGYLQ